MKLKNKETGETIIEVKGVLFDMDGVLFNSMPLHAKAWVDTLNAAGVPFSVLDVYRNEGSRGSETVQNAYFQAKGCHCSQQEEARLYKEKSRIYQSLPAPAPIDGAKALTELLKQHNVKMTVVTGSGEWTTIDRLFKFFPNCFEKDKLVTAYDIKIGKPHPEPYLKGLEKLGTTKGHTIVVENAPLGIKAGVAAGMFTIGVNTGPLANHELADAGANLVLNGMNELISILEA